MLRVVTLNLNGIRSAVAKGYLRWLTRVKADCVCMQELKAQECDLGRAMVMPGKLKGYFDCGETKGYSGVAMYARVEPDRVTCGFGSKEFDREGRFLRLDFGRLSVVSLYMPSGSSGAERQQAKFRFLDEFMPVLRELVGSGRECIVCGDWNIAHKEIDLKNWRSNQKNSGFLPEERAWLTEVFEKAGWVDVFRRLDPRPDQYTWWSTRGQAWAKNVGWRIDYQIATPGVAGKALRTRIFKAQRFSDHAPLIVDYDWDLASAQQAHHPAIAAPDEQAVPRPPQDAARRERRQRYTDER
jgi:exodeoxyribonuclease-3